MATKSIGVTVSLVALLGSAVVIAIFAFGTAKGASDEAKDAQQGVAVNEIRIEGLQVDIRRVQTQHAEQNAAVQKKLDVLIDRGP